MSVKYRRPKWGAVLSGVGALALVAVVAACSSSTSSTGSSTSTGSSSSSTGALGSNPIKIGEICDCSGALASAGVDDPNVYQAWANTVNATNFNEFAVGAWVSGQLFTTAAKAGGLGANGSTPTSAQLVTGCSGPSSRPGAAASCWWSTT